MIYIDRMSCRIADGADKAYYEGIIPADIIIPEDYAQQFIEDNSRNGDELIARQLISAVSWIMESDGVIITGEDTGVSAGTSQGCFEVYEKAASGIMEKGAKGTRPHDLMNMVVCGISSKIAIKFGLKRFNSTCAQNENSGLDALIYGYDMLRKGIGKACVVCAGDEKSDGSAAMLLISDSRETGVSIEGRSKGIIWSDNAEEQTDILIDNAISLANLRIKDISEAVLIASGNENCDRVYSELSRRIKSSREVTYPDSSASEKGLLTVISEVSRLETEDTLLLMQLGRDGCCSCVIMRKS